MSSRVLRLALALLPTACTDPTVPITGPDGGSSSGRSTQGGSEGDSSSNAMTAGSTSPSASDSGMPPLTSTGEGSEGDTSTSSDSVCGDGRIEGDEECDDGNVADGDTCRADCRVPFEVLDMSQIHLGNDLVFRVAVDGRGTVWAAGAISPQGASGIDPVLLSVTPEGTIEPVWMPETAAEDSLSGVEVLPSGDLVVVGGFDESGTDRDGHLARITALGEVVWAQNYDGPGGDGESASRDYAHDVSVNDSGEVIVAYSSSEVGEGTDIRISKSDETGAEIWSWTYAGAAHQDDAPNTLALAPNGDIVFAGYSRESPGLPGGVLGRLSDDGELLAVQTSVPDSVLAVGVDAEGVVAVGAGWLERRSPGLDTVLYTDLSPGFDVGFGVTPIAGGFVVTGGLGVPGEQSNAFVGAWGNDGTSWWRESFDNLGTSLNDTARDAALAPDGTLVVVGTLTELGAGYDIFVRRYRLFE